MSGVSAHIDFDDRELTRAIAALSTAQIDELGDVVGALVEDQVKRRISDEKTAPDGSSWEAWSAGYAAQLQERGKTAGSLLEQSGDLRDSIQHFSRGDDVHVGTPLIYGAIHQFGGDVSQGHPAIPARPYLGISDENAREIKELVIGQLEGLFQ
ncbi:phage virion morphogenesis protein [Celeribacter sp.]|uniref:phage virion morphogenesis protein n=1 Tax=Celeribacter sp. TaxID=1890673 RepID=UPI003A952ADA